MSLRQPKILVYDIESAGVNAFNADLGYVLVFGYIWLSDFEKGKKWKTISIGDFKRFKKNPHDDTDVIKEALKILNQADGIIHHYGNKFDAPFLLTRAEILRLEGFPDLPMLDTCFLAYKRFKFFSNRLKNIALALKCKYNKIEKNDGWPKWWLAYLKGDLRYDKKMRKYCGYDVMTLAEISLRMRKYWPKQFTNRLYSKNCGRICNSCGSTKLSNNGFTIYRRMIHKKLACRNCGSRANYEKVE